MWWTRSLYVQKQEKKHFYGGRGPNLPIAKGPHPLLLSIRICGFQMPVTSKPFIQSGWNFFPYAYCGPSLQFLFYAWVPCFDSFWPKIEVKFFFEVFAKMTGKGGSHIFPEVGKVLGCHMPNFRSLGQSLHFLQQWGGWGGALLSFRPKKPFFLILKISPPKIHPEIIRPG